MLDGSSMRCMRNPQNKNLMPSSANANFGSVAWPDWAMRSNPTRQGHQNTTKQPNARPEKARDHSKSSYGDLRVAVVGPLLS